MVINNFTQHAAEWWNPDGSMRLLHRLNPLRLDWIARQVAPLAEKNILDIGCGGGLLSEGLAKMGGYVTGIDISPELINIAENHKKNFNLSIDYFNLTPEDFYKNKNHKKNFDLITCLEVIEHVEHPENLIKTISELLKPEGYFIISTLNRNLKSFIFSIIVAEYILKLLPQATHEYQKFIKPEELTQLCAAHNLKLIQIDGIAYSPCKKRFKLTRDITVNYIALFQKI